MSTDDLMVKAFSGPWARPRTGSEPCDVATWGHAVAEVNQRPEFLQPDPDRLAAAVCGRLLLNLPSALDHEFFGPLAPRVEAVGR